MFLTLDQLVLSKMRRYLYIFLLSLIVSFLNVCISIYLYSSNICILNEGVAFGISIKYELLISTLLLFGIMFLGIFAKGRMRYILFSLLTLGISNLLIRIMYGGVCDYIGIFNIYVNIADITIVIVSLLSILLITKRNGEK